MPLPRLPTASAHLLAGLLVAASLAGCTTPPAPRVAVVPEAWISAPVPADNVDSVAAWHGPAGEAWVLATTKGTHQILVLDAATGRELRRIGGAGPEPGRFQRPNGIAVDGSQLWVVERDNRRVQVLTLPDFGPGSPPPFGSDVLAQPYGLALVPGGIVVTDQDESVDAPGAPTPDALTRRLHRWDLGPDGPTRHRTFGPASGPGALRIVESAWADPVHDRLLVAEEEESRRRGGLVAKAFTLDGAFRGEIVGDGLFRHQVEGIALDARADGAGYWIIADQGTSASLFHLFDRRTLAHVGTFRGPVTRKTDGIWLDPTPVPHRPRGTFYAVHNDEAVAAFDYASVLRALALP